MLTYVYIGGTIKEYQSTQTKKENKMETKTVSNLRIKKNRKNTTIDGFNHTKTKLGAVQDIATIVNREIVVGYLIPNTEEQAELFLENNKDWITLVMEQPTEYREPSNYFCLVLQNPHLTSYNKLPLVKDIDIDYVFDWFEIVFYTNNFFIQSGVKISREQLNMLPLTDFIIEHIIDYIIPRTSLELTRHRVKELLTKEIETSESQEDISRFIDVDLTDILDVCGYSGSQDEIELYNGLSINRYTLDQSPMIDDNITSLAKHIFDNCRRKLTYETILGMLTNAERDLYFTDITNLKKRLMLTIHELLPICNISILYNVTKKHNYLVSISTGDKGVVYLGEHDRVTPNIDKIIYNAIKNKIIESTNVDKRTQHHKKFLFDVENRLYTRCVKIYPDIKISAYLAQEDTSVERYNVIVLIYNSYYRSSFYVAEPDESINDIVKSAYDNYKDMMDSED